MVLLFGLSLFCLGFLIYLWCGDCFILLFGVVLDFAVVDFGLILLCLAGFLFPVILF